jgi:hypothetical protein
MTKKVTRQEADDATTSRGTVKGHHAKPGDDVTEGGLAPAPTEGHGAPKGSASKAAIEGAEEGDNTSTATVGKAEKEHAAQAGAAKTKEGRGHRKHGD